MIHLSNKGKVAEAGVLQPVSYFCMISVVETSQQRTWVHRSLGAGKTKGCDPDKIVWGDCIAMTVNDNPQHSSIIWTLPGDKLGAGRYVPQCVSIPFRWFMQSFQDQTRKKPIVIEIN